MCLAADDPEYRTNMIKPTNLSKELQFFEKVNTFFVMIDFPLWLNDFLLWFDCSPLLGDQQRIVIKT